MKNIKKMAVIMAVVMMIASLTGCGEMVTKEFKAPNETFSIQMDEKWSPEDMQDDGTLAIFNKSGTEGIVVMQFPKNSEYAVGDMENLKTVVRTSLSMNNVTDAEAPEVPGLENVCAATAGMILEGQTEESYTVYGETDYAHYSMTYIAKKMTDKKTELFKGVCASFVENAPEVENNSQVALTDTILWFNATNAILSAANGWDYTMLGGLPANAESQAIQEQMLDEWWSVTDRQSADETLDWLLTEGHRFEFNDAMSYYGSEGLADVAEADRAAWFYENFDATEEEAAAIADWYTLYEAGGDKTIAAWDYSRAMSLLGYYYVAGYYTETEALDKSLEVATEIQSMFTSWDEFMESYFIGYEYWSEESSEERRAIYEELKAEADSPYNLDWNMTFEKTW